MRETMTTQPPKAILYRILGNDLPPRYAPGQTLENLRFTLEHEDEFPGLEKRWLLNRIVDPAVEQALRATIAAAGHPCDGIPFRLEEYRQAWTDLGDTPPEFHPWGETFQTLTALQQARISDYIGRAKNLYLMNNNGARNRALELGFAAGADWVFPWDGGCLLPDWAWEELRQLLNRPDLHYLCIPMHRLRDLNQLPAQQDCEALELVEPQLGFSREAAIGFDPQLRYGSGPKWQVLQRIGVPGPWQQGQGWLPWERVDTSPAPDAGAWVEAGLVLRLSGETNDQRHVDEDGLWRLRFASIRRFTRQVDMQDVQEMLRATPYRHWTQLNPPAQPADQAALQALAAEQVRRLDDLADPWEGMAWLALDAGLNGASASRTRLLELLQLHGLGDGGRALDSMPAGLVPLLDGLTLLRRQGSFSAEEWQGIQQWCERLLTGLLQASEVSLQQQPEGSLSSWQHLLILALAAFLGRADICCQVIDNLPGLLAHQGLAPGEPLLDQGTAMVAEEELSLLDAWRRLVQLCASIGRSLSPEIPCGLAPNGFAAQVQGQPTQPFACSLRSH